MNAQIEEILNEYGQKIVEAIKQILVDEDKVVTGRTRDSLSFEVEDNVLKNSIALFILTLTVSAGNLKD